MKTLLISFAFALVSSLVLAQTATENYVKSTSYKQPVQNQTQIDALSNDDKIETINYLDGLGRAKQSIAKQAGGNREDIITPMVYDDYGRQQYEYLPYFRTTSSFNYETQDSNFFNTLDTQYLNKYVSDLDGTYPNPFSEKHFEHSPLNRVLEQGAPGKDWAVDTLSSLDHTIKFEYLTNSNKVGKFITGFPTQNTEAPQLFYDGEYLGHELYKTITKDENWQPNQTHPEAHTTEEFTNSLGQVILKRNYDSGGINHDTHYVYDDFGNLTYVLSPKGTDAILVAEKSYVSFTDTEKYDSFIPLDRKGNPITTGSGGVDVIVDASANTITVDFDLYFDTNINLKNGAIFLLSQPMPDMIIGLVDSGNYTVSIQDGYLYIGGSGTLDKLLDNITVTLLSHSIDNNVLNDLCYQYHYDKRNRLVEKKIPQKGWEYIVYDKLDRPLATQDALQRAKVPMEWSFTKYDDFDRVAYTGTFTTIALVGSRGNVQANADSSGSESSSATANTIDNTNVYYTNTQYPTGNLTLHTVNYYDGYNATLTNAFVNPSTVFSQNVTSDTRSLTTGGLVRVLDTNNWITSVTYFDGKAQPIYVGSKNDYLNTTDSIKSELDFTGIVTKTESSHVKGTNAAIVVTDRFTYDHANRLLTQKQQITGEPEELIVKNSYDELGQLTDKDVGNSETTPLQTVDYSYNIRGWLTQINNPDAIGSDLFCFKINYNTVELGLNNNKLFNSNVSETIWKTANDPIGTKRGYAYEYDALNRIESGNMAIDTGTGYSQANGYHLNGLKYDKNGNILELQRTGQTNIFDDLLYAYNGNQLDQITDAVTNQQTEGFIDLNTAGTDYMYDANGNMILDKNKEITSIEYNHLNLPTEVIFNNSSTKKIDYIYDATGLKMKKVVNDNGNITTTEYAGNYIYQNSGLQFFSHPEGYVEPDGTDFNYVYQYKDHLGSIRLAYSDSNSNGSITISEIIEENNYYPFGLKHKGYNNVVNGTDHPYGFEEQEEQNQLGLNWLQFKWRNHDPAIGRFMSVDPLTEKYNWMTPYQFASNQVIHGREIEGLENYNDLSLNPAARTLLKTADDMDRIGYKGTNRPMFTFGIGVSKSKSASHGLPGALGTDAKVEASANLELQVTGNGQTIIEGNLKAGGKANIDLLGNNYNGNFYLLDETATYNKTISGENQRKIEVFDSSQDSERLSDLEIELTIAIAYVAVNVSELNRAAQDIWNVGMSFLDNLIEEKNPTVTVLGGGEPQN